MKKRILTLGIAAFSLFWLSFSNAKFVRIIAQNYPHAPQQQNSIQQGQSLPIVNQHNTITTVHQTTPAQPKNSPAQQLKQEQEGILDAAYTGIKSGLFEFGTSKIMEIIGSILFKKTTNNTPPETFPTLVKGMVYNSLIYGGAIGGTVAYITSKEGTSANAPQLPLTKSIHNFIMSMLNSALESLKTNFGWSQNTTIPTWKKVILAATTTTTSMGSKILASNLYQKLFDS